MANVITDLFTTTSYTLFKNLASYRFNKIKNGAHQRFIISSQNLLTTDVFSLSFFHIYQL